jgi:hypothetical protein
LAVARSLSSLPPLLLLLAPTVDKQLRLGQVSDVIH